MQRWQRQTVATGLKQHSSFGGGRQLAAATAEWFRRSMAMDSKFCDFCFVFSFFVYLAYYDLFKLCDIQP
jgi:hypothetical protein